MFETTIVFLQTQNSQIMFSHDIQYKYKGYNELMIVTFLLLALAAAQCPDVVSDEQELISQPVDCFKRLYNHKNFDNHKIQRAVTERLHTYQRMLQELSMSDKEHLQTAPVVKWAQNNAQIFISFKLSHRQDSPTCSDIRSQSFKTQDILDTKGDIPFETSSSTTGTISAFSYRGECFFTTQKFWYSLALNFQAPVSKLAIRKQGFGMYTLVADKTDPGIWTQPFTDFKKAAIWTQLRNKYESDMNKYFEQAQALVDSGQEGKRKRRRRPKNGTINNQL